MENSTSINSDIAEEEISLADLLEVLRKYLLGATIVALLAGAITFFASSREPKVYRATAKIVVNFADGRSGAELDVGPPPLDLSAYKEVALSPNIIQQVLGRETEARGLSAQTNNFKVETVEGKYSGLLRLRVDALSPKTAAAEANKWAQSLLAWENKRVLGKIQAQKRAVAAQLAAVEHQLASMSTLDDRYTSLSLLRAQIQKKYDQLEIIEAGAQPRMQLLETAHPPERAIKPRPLLNAVAAATMAGLLVITFGFFKEAVSPFVRRSEEAAAVTDLPILAEFPRLPPRSRTELPMEAAEFLRVGLKRLLLRDEPAILLVTSSVEGEGKTSVAIALAKALAQEERPTLLVDADLRRPVLGKLFGLESSPGILRSFATLEDAAVEAVSNLYIVPCHHPPDGPVEILGRYFREWIRYLSAEKRYRYIVVDGAPLLPVADTLAIAPYATGVLLVAAEMMTRKKNLVRSVQLLNSIGVQPHGMVMNRVRQPSTVFLGGYGSRQYGYGRAHSRNQTKTFG